MSKCFREPPLVMVETLHAFIIHGADVYHNITICKDRWISASYKVFKLCISIHKHLKDDITCAAVSLRISQQKDCQSFVTMKSAIMGSYEFHDTLTKRC